MKVKHSPLQWKEFALLQFYLKFNGFEDEKQSIEPADYFSENSIEADFTIREHSENLVQVFFKTEINMGEKPLAGYSIHAEATGVFQIKRPDELSEQIIKNLKGYSTVNLLINRLRHNIRTLTAESAFGPYEYPPIDITALFKQKQQNQAAKNMA